MFNILLLNMMIGGKWKADWSVVPPIPWGKGFPILFPYTLD